MLERLHSNRIKTGVVFAYLLSCAFSGVALACDLELRRTPSPTVLNYDPFQFTATLTTVELEVENLSDTPCTTNFRIFDQAGAPPPFRYANIDLELSANLISQALIGQTSNGIVSPGVVTLEISPETIVPIAVEFEIVGTPNIESGSYVNTLFFEFQNLQGATLISALEAQVQLDVISRAQVNVAGAAAGFENGSTVEVVNFGELETGETARVFIQLRANTSAILTIESENQGVMRHETSADATPASYIATLDSELIDLTQPYVKSVNPPRTVSGVSVPFDIQIGPVEHLAAGRYRDTIFVSIAPD